MKRIIILASIFSGFTIGLFIILSQMISMDYSKWLIIHNSIIIISIFLCGLFGFKSKSLIESLKLSGTFVWIFFTFYLVCYLISTTVLVDQLRWIPFFYEDYTHHGFNTVKEYLSSDHRFVELLKLQIFSLLINLLFYLSSSMLGYGIKRLINSMTIKKDR